MEKSSLDALYARVASKVLTESLSLKKGESLTIESWNNGLPFARQVVLEARRIGATPLTVFEDEEAYVEGVRSAPADMVGKMGKNEYRLISGSDAYVFIPGPVLGSFSHKLSREEVAKSTEYGDSWYKAAAKSKLRGVRLVFGYIGDEAVETLGRSVRSVVSHQLEASLVDYRQIRKKANDLKASLDKGGVITVSTPNSQLQLKLNGTFEVEDGVVDEQDVASGNNVCYIPPGFVYAGLEPESVSGRFAFSPTVTRFGMITDGTVEFRDGEVVGISSEGSKPALDKLAAAASKSAKRASALTVGLNPGLRYGYGQNANSAGVVGVRILGVNFTARSPSLKAQGKALVSRGRL